MKFSKKILSNGLTVVEVPGNDAESVVVDIFVKTGSRSETAKESGISHFLEHFLFKGTKKYPSALTISELVDSIGGEMNANTGKEHTQYYIKAASQHLTLIFDILTDMVQHPLLDAGELEREKNVIVEEINMYKDTPMYEIENVLERTMWPQDPLGRDIAGDKETVTKFTRQMFASYIQRHYQTPNMIIGISGKYDKQKFSKLIREKWSGVRRAAYGGWKKVSDSQKQSRLSLSFKETEQAHLALGFKSFGYDDPRNAAVSVLGAILGGGMSSRLFIEVRERRGLAYYVRAAPGSYQDTGSFTIGSGVQVTKIQEALAVIVEQIRRIKREPVEARELEKAKEYIKGKTVLALEDNQVRLDWFLERTAFYKKIETAQEVFRRIDAVTGEDVQKVANRIFQNQGLSLAIIGPYKKEKDFRKLLDVR